MFYIIIKNQDGVWVTYGDEDFETYEDAQYQLDALKEMDDMNGESHEYKICEVEDIVTVNRNTGTYRVIWKKINKEDLLYTTNNMFDAISKARETHSVARPWEQVFITCDGAPVPYRVFVACRETGDIIEEIKGMEIDEAIEKGLGIIADYEEEDKLTGDYEPNFYDIVDEHAESYIY